MKWFVREINFNLKQGIKVDVEVFKKYFGYVLCAFFRRKDTVRED